MNLFHEEKFLQRLVREATIKAGSPLDLAVEIDASEKSIYKWMNATSLPDAKHLIRLLNYLGLLVS